MQALGYQIAPPAWSNARFLNLTGLSNPNFARRQNEAGEVDVPPDRCPPLAFSVPAVLGSLGFALVIPLAIYINYNNGSCTIDGSDFLLSCNHYVLSHFLTTLAITTFCCATFVFIIARKEPPWSLLSFTRTGISHGNAFVRVRYVEQKR